MRGVLEGQVAVVTGGFGGIGQAFAARAREAGAGICCWDIAAEPDRDSHESYVRCDVTDEVSVRNAVAQTLEAFGKIDILVNAAGITRPTARTEEYSLAAWDRVLAINLTGTFLCCRAVVEPMRARDYGRIVNLSSIAGKEGNPNQPAYSASKAGVMALTKTLGKELAQTGVRVNCITPGFTATHLMYQMSEAQRRLVLEKIPMGRAAEPKEIAELIVFLASPACSFSTGAVFDASGGRATY